MPDYFGGDKSKNMPCGANYYYDATKCGVGFHGDTESKKVIAVRLGATLQLHYQWMHKGWPVGDRVKISLDHGDMYVMSEKATGHDWMSRNEITLKHAAGCKKYLVWSASKV